MPWLAAATVLILLMIGLVWAERIVIARHLIDREIRHLKLSARYRIDEIGAGKKVFADISIGDPTSPDLFVRTLEIDTGWRGGLPAVTGLKLTGARLRGNFSNGHVSFGSLDPIIFAPSSKPFRLPDIALTLRDSQVRIGGDQGPIGIDLNGDGNLRGGFAAGLAVVAPSLRARGCAGNAVNFHGRLAIRDEQPRVFGPLRMVRFSCPASALAVQAPAVQVDIRLDPTLNAGAAQFGLTTGPAKLGTQGAARLSGGGDASLRSGVLAARFALGGDNAYAVSASATRLAISGQLRATLGRGAVAGTGTLSGYGIAPDAKILTALERVAASTAGTLAAPLLSSLRDGIGREITASRLSGSWRLARSPSGTDIVLPEVHLDGAQTAHWLALSEVLLKQRPGSDSRSVAGNFSVAGRSLPQFRGQIRPLADGSEMASLALPPWVAARSSLAVPILALHWNRDGALGIDGSAILSGPLPGGHVTGLAIPLEGSWSAGNGLRLGSHCTAVTFGGLTIGALDLGPANAAGRALTLCPGGAGGAMVVLDARGPLVSLRSPGLRLDGRVDGTTLSIVSGTAALTWPGGLSVRDIEVALKDATTGSAGTTASPASHLGLAQLTASLGTVTAGHFSGGDVSLAATPAVVRSATGDFRWADGRLTVDSADFRIEDAAKQPRFAPIHGQGATFTIADGAINGAVSLRATTANRELVHVAIVDALASGIGHADVSMPALTFDKALQPKQLSALAEGVIADAQGMVTGSGRFDWSHGHITSSGSIATTGFDFAAAFGPVKGVAGTIEFTDLLGLVTAPDQKLAIAMINPGIEVDDGQLIFALQPGHVLSVAGAQWPFLDGRLALLPTRLVLGATEVRRYELRVDGLNAAKFLARMDLSNLAATGIFDGNLPMVFDESGGRIDHGLLLSRAPGGTVSYVGELTYKDLSPMANYAFQALRALKYRQMRIGMDGALAGDIVTRVSMQGVGQAKGAKRNFITNQIARLPIQFDVNIAAPFMQLVTSFRSLYDPALVADPRTLGLIDAQGRAVPHPASDNLPPPTKTPTMTPPAIQP